ncbi:histone acetyltransferase HAC1 [Lotus japonicus]|uniref:histone acetyltransferase HAC1 n=1 Tax=Lotus japonicus TaxID=34305 RepID=UPI0025840BF1|nr:histone acetyltransferase HAC1 [Lotus japonicus]
MKIEVPRKTSGQGSDQAGSQMPVPNQMNGNALPLMANATMDPELLEIRSLILEKIHSTLLERCPRPISEEKRRMLKNLAIRLEAGLVKDASSRAEYVNLDTVESRLTDLIRRASQNDRYQQYRQLVSSIGAMTI